MENCAPTSKLTLIQTLTLTGGQFSSGAMVWLPPTLTKLKLDLNPNPNLGAIFFEGRLSGYHILAMFFFS